MSWFKKRLPNKVACIDVVNAYGAVLEDEPVGFAGTMPEEKLPFDKAIIKAAIIEVARTPGVTKAQIEMLGAGFVQLAVFQPGGGGKSVAFRPGAELPKTRGEMMAVAQEWAGAGEELAKADAVSNEMAAMLEEWKLVILGMVGATNA